MGQELLVRFLDTGIGWPVFTYYRLEKMILHHDGRDAHVDGLNYTDHDLRLVCG
jgi:hypothetical protein